MLICSCSRDAFCNGATCFSFNHIGRNVSRVDTRKRRHKLRTNHSHIDYGGVFTIKRDKHKAERQLNLIQQARPPDLIDLPKF